MFDKLYNKTTGLIEPYTKHKYYEYYLTLFLCIVCVIFASPFSMSINPGSMSWQCIMLKANDLTNNLSQYPPASWLAKKVFRITVPVFIKVFHLNAYTTLLLQLVLGVFLILTSYKLSLKILNDKVAATFVATAIIFTYFGRACFVDLTDLWFDGWAFAALIFAMYATNPFLIFVLCSVVAWTDERAFLTIPIVVLFHQFWNVEKRFKNDFAKLFHFNKKTIAVITAMVSYVCLRAYLSFAFGMKTPTSNSNGVGIVVIIKNIKLIVPGMLSFIEGFWILFFVTIAMLIRMKHYFITALILLQTALLTIPALSVFDITRSGGYLMPLVFVMIVFVVQNFNIQKIRSLLFRCLLFTFLLPPYFIVSSWKPPIYLHENMVVKFVKKAILKK